MEYTVGEVFEQATDAIERPFAIPTVLESRNSEFFFPAPSGSGEGYAVDLDTSVARDPIREFLHVRLIYKHDHLARVVHSTGPTPPVDLAAARNTHLVSVRARCARPDYGARMSEEVDA